MKKELKELNKSLQQFHYSELTYRGHGVGEVVIKGREREIIALLSDSGEADPMTCDLGLLRATIFLGADNELRAAFLQGIALERASLQSLEEQVAGAHPESVNRALIQGIAHARTIQAAASGGASEKYRG